MLGKRVFGVRTKPTFTPTVGRVRFGDLRRLAPISANYGFDRGRPVDRHYIEQFLRRHQADVRGWVLELGDDTYAKQFGGDRVAGTDVLHGTPGNPRATVVADLAVADHLPSDKYDCILLTQAIFLMFDVRAVIGTLHRILRPGGVLLVTTPGISKIDRDPYNGNQDSWRFTEYSLRRRLEESFPADLTTVESFGNVLAATAFLYGLADSELTPEELAYHDADYPLIVAARAVKPPQLSCLPPSRG